MKSKLKKLIALVGMTVLAVSSMQAQDSGALVDALVKKGVLTDQEGEEIRADLTKEYATTSAGKLNISNHITQLKLYGDARWRYEYVGQEYQKSANTDNSTHNWRARYRIRLGADYAFTDKFTAGFELESAADNDSANQNIGGGFDKFSLNVGLLYLTYKPWDFVTLTGGKIKNPLYTTDLLWDADINPEGAAELFSWNVGDSLSVGLTAAQFNYTENNDSAGTAATATNYNYNSTSAFASSNANSAKDSWIYVAQVPVTYNFNKSVSSTIAPAFYLWTDGSTNTGTSNTFNSGGPNFKNANGASDLVLLAAPGDIKFNAWDQKMKFYWDFVYNTKGNERIHDVYGATSTTGASAAALGFNGANADLTDSIAWLVGFQIGDNKKKGDWLVGIDFRQVGAGSVDPNLNDSDFGNGFLNQQGVKIRTGYNFTDFLQANVSYFNTWNYKSDLFFPVGTAGSNGSGNTANLAGINGTSRLQLDLVWKF